MSFNGTRLCILRLMLVEILRQAVHRTSGVTPDDLPVTVQDACVVAGCFSEACGFGMLHIDHTQGRPSKPFEAACATSCVTSPRRQGLRVQQFEQGQS